MVLDFENIHVQYGRKEILYGVDLSVEKGKITGIVGPNGCGKSTLVKTVFGIAPMKEGKIILEGQDTGKMTRKELSEKLGYVGQETASSSCRPRRPPAPYGPGRGSRWSAAG